jgi:demethylmenaquinone methyltransferase/2-methoxy-6-polyprenyl-1,4-benzoquinol methylase
VSSDYYSPDEQRAAKVRLLFAVIARRYDLLNDVMSGGLHRLWKRRVAQLVGASRRLARVPAQTDEPAARPYRLLDLCCGTGDIALRLSGAVVGVDFTFEMLQVGARRGGNFVQADALRLPFAGASFDAVTVGYGLRNLADLDAGLREIQRVLRPGGRLVSLDFGKPDSPMWRKMYFAHLRFWVPVLGWLLAGDRQAYAYILPSLEKYPGQRGVQTAMAQCGFLDCRYEDLVGGAMAINHGTKSR